ncbi:MAG: hypothetical protein ACPGXZ_01770 [Saprospiraceae bacterium]
MGDADIEIKYGFPTKLPLAATLAFGLPLGQSVTGEQNNLQTDAGAGFNIVKNVSFYMSTMVGFNNRTNGFSDKFRYSIKLV